MRIIYCSLSHLAKERGVTENKSPITCYDTGGGDPRVSFAKTLWTIVSRNTILLGNDPNQLFHGIIIHLTQAHITRYTLCPFILQYHLYAHLLLALCGPRTFSSCFRVSQKTCLTTQPFLPCKHLRVWAELASVLHTFCLESGVFSSQHPLSRHTQALQSVLPVPAGHFPSSPSISSAAIARSPSDSPTPMAVGVLALMSSRLALFMKISFLVLLLCSKCPWSSQGLPSCAAHWPAKF